MATIFKYLLKNLWEKKGRTFLLLLSVCLVCALVFASSAIGDTFVNIFVNRAKLDIGNSDLVISADEKSPSSYLSPAKAVESGRYAYAVPKIQGTLVYQKSQKESFNLITTGIRMEDALRMSLFALDGQPNGEFSGMMVILPKAFAEKHGISPGSFVTLESNKISMKFQVYGLSDNGMFTDNGFSNSAVVPFESLSSLYGVKGMGTSLWVKLNNPADLTAEKEFLTELYKGYTVKEPIDAQDMTEQVSDLSMPFLLMTMIVAFMSIFIIYSSFRVIAAERLPVIGTFRSVGATKKTTDFIMLGESLSYGILGSLLGFPLGLLILKMIAKGMLAGEFAAGFVVETQYRTTHVVTAVLLAIGLCFFSSLFPILKVSRLSVKDIILGTQEKTKKHGLVRFIAGVVMVLVAVFLPPLLPETLAMLGSIICMLLVMSGGVMLVPYIMSFFVWISEHVFQILFGNIGALAAKGLRENRSIQNNITMLAIGIASLLMINTISSSVAMEVGNVYSRLSFDISVYGYPLDRTALQKVVAHEGVTDAYGVYDVNNVKVIGTEKEIGLLSGVDYRTYFDWYDYDIEPKFLEKMPLLEAGRNILLTNAMAKSVGTAVGENIRLKLGGREYDYTVIGYYETLMYNGQVGIISEQYLKMDARLNTFSTINVRTNEDPEEVVKTLTESLSRYYPFVISNNEMERINQQSNDSMFMILKAFSMLAMLIGIIGVVNNLIVAFIQRKRHFAMMRSVGMNKHQMLRMILLESISGGLIGGFAGGGIGLLVIYVIKYVLAAIDLPVRLTVSPQEVMTMIIGGMLLMLVASISPALRSSKMKLVESLKYE